MHALLRNSCTYCFRKERNPTFLMRFKGMIYTVAEFAFDKCCRITCCSALEFLNFLKFTISQRPDQRRPRPRMPGFLDPLQAVSGKKIFHMRHPYTWDWSLVVSAFWSLLLIVCCLSSHDVYFPPCPCSSLPQYPAASRSIAKQVVLIFGDFHAQKCVKHSMFLPFLAKK